MEDFHQVLLDKVNNLVLELIDRKSPSIAEELIGLIYVVFSYGLNSTKKHRDMSSSFISRLEKAITNSKYPELTNAVKAEEVLGSPFSAFRLWAITSFQCGHFSEQLEQAFDKLKMDYLPNSAFVQVGNQVCSYDKCLSLSPNLVPLLLQLLNALAVLTPENFSHISYDFRQVFEASLEPKIRRGAQKRKLEPLHIIGQAAQANLEQICIVRRVFDDCTRSVFERANIPPGIANTEALRVLFYATVVCVNAKVPLTQLGPAGSSKTLSYVLVEENMTVRSLMILGRDIILTVQHTGRVVQEPTLQAS